MDQCLWLSCAPGATGPIVWATTRISLTIIFGKLLEEDIAWEEMEARDEH